MCAHRMCVCVRANARHRAYTFGIRYDNVLVVITATHRCICIVTILCVCCHACSILMSGIRIMWPYYFLIRTDYVCAHRRLCVRVCMRVRVRATARARGRTCVCVHICLRSLWCGHNVSCYPLMYACARTNECVCVCVRVCLPTECRLK